jgi:hypothetical protein
VQKGKVANSSVLKSATNRESNNFLSFGKVQKVKVTLFAYSLLRKRK